jgi:hypothetical protein
MKRVKPTDRAFLLHYARVLLAEAKARRNSVNRGFSFWLLDAVGRARREAMRLPKQTEQMQLFEGGMA